MRLVFGTGDDPELTTQALRRKATDPFLPGAGTAILARDRVANLCIARQPHEAIDQLVACHPRAVIDNLETTLGTGAVEIDLAAGSIGVIGILDELGERGLLTRDQLATETAHHGRVGREAHDVAFVQRDLACELQYRTKVDDVRLQRIGELLLQVT